MSMWMTSYLAEGLVIQMPDNQHEPSHALMRLIAADGPWLDEGFRNSGEPIEPQAPAPNVKPLEELEHLLSVLRGGEAASGSYRCEGLVERFGPEGRPGRSA
jgi:trans-aconitate methyltransferase